MGVGGGWAIEGLQLRLSVCEWWLEPGACHHEVCCRVGDVVQQEVIVIITIIVIVKMILIAIITTMTITTRTQIKLMITITATIIIEPPTSPTTRSSGALTLPLALDNAPDVPKAHNRRHLMHKNGFDLMDTNRIDLTRENGVDICIRGGARTALALSSGKSGRCGGR